MTTGSKPIIEVTDEMMEEGAGAMAEGGLFGTDNIPGADWSGWKDTAREVFNRMLDIAYADQE